MVSLDSRYRALHRLACLSFRGRVIGGLLHAA